ncbi:helix-turn-helix transcriptional regulator [Actinomycetospora termitidis]|uniref:WYL domain-containing protein n=1 Tax=Actinomycetospora termitidis TaxID=3053470 RepID=A0ABT7MB28_9PSEU|nr:WYL domain-containing protein [Actinomycetospora sp. Odt1-22]MDL5157864.1 WYL domain-containing protein [Actinomycetospora sp. Odt1-22]
MHQLNRTDRLYALAEELRAVAPRPRSARWLAARFEVSVRTVERDLDALKQSGVPITADTGRSGGYSLDRARTLPPLALTAGEALAVGIALRSAASSPFAGAARSAARKVLAGLSPDVRRREEVLAARVHTVGDVEAPAGTPTDTLADAVASGRVLRLAYTDSAGHDSQRDVEPLGLLWGTRGWYLMAWCRRREGVRGFHVGRITAVTELAEHAPPRDADLRRELDRLDADPLRT